MKSVDDTVAMSVAASILIALSDSEVISVEDSVFISSRNSVLEDSVLILVAGGWLDAAAGSGKGNEAAFG